MGRSAKLHKRVKKTASSVSQAARAPVQPMVSQTSAGKASAFASASANTKRQAGLKDKAASSKRGSGEGGHVLGGADYVDLMMGSRKRAREEAKKIPAS